VHCLQECWVWTVLYLECMCWHHCPL